MTATTDLRSAILAGSTIAEMDQQDAESMYRVLSEEIIP